MIVALVVFVCALGAGAAGYRIGRTTTRFVPPRSPQHEHTPVVQLMHRPAPFDWQREDPTR